MLCNITQNAMGILAGLAGRGTLPGGTQTGYPPARSGQGVSSPGGYQGRVPPPGQTRRGGTLLGGYPVRTTEGVLTTRQAVCLLRLRRRIFLLLKLLKPLEVNLHLKCKFDLLVKKSIKFVIRAQR